MTIEPKLAKRLERIVAAGQLEYLLPEEAAAYCRVSRGPIPRHRRSTDTNKRLPSPLFHRLPLGLS